MTKFRFLAIALAGVATAWAVAQEGLPPGSTPPAGGTPTDARPYSYAIGLDLGLSFQADGLELDVESLLAGVRDGLQQAEPRYSPEVCGAALQQLSAARMERFRVRNEEFLEKNGSVEGVRVTPSGLQYQVLKEGAGPNPGPRQTVRVHYRGQLIDGSVFDQSFGGEPAEFRVTEVIPGWTEALQNMRAGDHWRLFIPSRLAYGTRGFGEVIPPHATLIFEVQLLEIVPQ